MIESDPEADFYARIADHPGDASGPLVLADFRDEHGEPNVAEVATSNR